MEREVFVQNIKIFSAAKGLKPTVACREAGVGASFINDINRGQTPSVGKVQQLAEYLGILTSDLLGEKRGSPAPEIEDEAALDRELISRLCRLTAEELEKVNAFVQGLLAAR